MSRLLILGNLVPSSLEIGTTIAVITVLDGSGTYDLSILNDPLNSFEIVGSSIRVANTINLQHNFQLTIQADNNAGDVIEETLIFSSAIEESESSYEFRVDTFFASTTWTAPADIIGNVAKVEVWAAGGGGSVIDTTHAAGGGGAYSRDDTYSVTPLNEYDIVIGTSSADTNGGDSSFDTTGVVAKGGLSGTNGGTGGQASAGTGTTKYSGGNGASGVGGNRSSGAGAGSNGDASGTTPGDPEGGNGTTGAGFFYSAGGGVVTAGGTSAAPPGVARITYQVSAPADYAYTSAITHGRATSSTTSHPITLPEAEIGDLLVVTFGIDTNSTISAPEDWTELEQDINGTTVAGAMFYKFAEGEDELTITTSATDFSSYIARTIKNAGTPTATVTNAFGVDGNPPEHTPAAGSNKYLWLADIVLDNSHRIAILPPSGYQNFLSQPSRSGGASTAISEKRAEASSEDPGSFDNSSTGWVAFTVSVPPA